MQIKSNIGYITYILMQVNSRHNAPTLIKTNLNHCIGISFMLGM